MKKPHLRKILATPDEEKTVRAGVRFCRDQELSMAGLYYDDPLVNINGILLVIYATEKTTDKQIAEAILQGFRDRDVVNYRTLICPEDWLK